MQYETVVGARFLRRPNRFLAQCELDGQEVWAHVKNTGRCRELLTEGTTVYLQDHRQDIKAGKLERKTEFSLIAVKKGDLLINMDSQVPNQAAFEGLQSGVIRLPLEPDEKLEELRREVKFGNSRFDIMARTNKKVWYVEVKGVTLESTDENGVRTARFPDAPTERGLKHIHELIKAREEGYGAALLFIIQMEKATKFEPNWETHAAFGEALQKAKERNVSLLAWDCQVKPDMLTACQPVPIELGGRKDRA